MPVVTATIAGKAAPEMGKKRGRLKDANGVVYQAMPAILDIVNVGSTYDLDYKDDEFKGAKFRVVESVTPAIGAPQQSVPPRQAPSYGQTGGGVMVPVKDDRSEDISVLAIIKCQQLPVGDRAGILHALKASALAWRDFKKWQKDGNIESGRQPLHDDGYPDNV